MTWCLVMMTTTQVSESTLSAKMVLAQHTIIQKIGHGYLNTNLRRKLKMEIIRKKLENGKTRSWVKRTPEEIEELKKKIEERKAKIEAKSKLTS